MTYIPIPNPLPITGSIINTPADASLDAFGRSRVSSPAAIFSSAFSFDLQPLMWDQIVVGSGSITHSPNTSSAVLTVTGASGDSAALQTKEWFRYQPGKSQLIFMTFLMPAASAGQDIRVGQFSTNNGVFLERTGSTVNFVRRTYTSGSAVDNAVAQASWSEDPMDGNGPSGVTLDLTKAQILVIDYQWLGYGRIRLGFDIGGNIIWAHEFRHANILTVPWATSANQPIQASITNTAATSAANLTVTCVSVNSEGGVAQEEAIPMSVSSNGTAVTAASGVDTPILSIRLKTTFNSIATTGIKVLLKACSAYVTGNPVLAKLWYNPTLTGAVFSDVNTSYSAVEKDVAATTFTGGFPIQQFFVPVASPAIKASSSGQGGLTGHLPVGLAATGVSTILLVTAQGVGGTSPTQVTLDWSEVR